MRLKSIAVSVAQGERLALGQLTELARADIGDLLEAASYVRDAGFGEFTTYSRKIFIPLTELCRDVCHYCTFAKAPRQIAHPFMSVEAVLDLAQRGKAAGCNEALFTLGEKPELRYRAAREWLDQAGFSSTIEYLAHVAGRVLKETGLLPHINAGTMTHDELKLLRQVSASMGIMLETASDRLSRRGMVHFGSPDKVPAARLGTIRAAGQLNIPVTSGILVGIGETMTERLESILALRQLHEEHGHLQEVIVQNFRAKPGTRMETHEEPTAEDFCRTIAVARLAFGPAMSIQAPPNLSPDILPRLVAAGINDWGGVSPVTRDHVNPEAPWPHIEELARQTAAAGKVLAQRLTVYPAYISEREKWIDSAVAPYVLRMADAQWLARECNWQAGSAALPMQSGENIFVHGSDKGVSAQVRSIVTRGRNGERLSVEDITRLFASRGDDLFFVCRAADELRREVNGNTVSSVVTRNINYTNICYYRCKFCAFSKGKTHDALRGTPYDLDMEEIVRRSVEAWDRGATEVCLQGGIHPDYTGQTYVEICKAIKAAVPGMHIHAFSPLEVTQGAATLGLSIPDFLARLKEAGLDTLPGTAAEILDDEIRAIICPDKINTAQWVEAVSAAHRLGLKTTSTIMYGHVEGPLNWARHLLVLRDLQAETGGITEFVPLPFVHMEAPMYLRGLARKGPTLREAVLMHAVARLVLHPLIPNIQTSWVKMGPEGAAMCLNAGANDMGGTLMNESISRDAGTQHGQEFPPEAMEHLIQGIGRRPRQRSTGYGSVSNERQIVSFNAAELAPVVQTPPKKVLAAE
ncbi:MAG: 5-amino-6-(D-ribitylamino)uracil--L-tyrosine 4-hydroxyphenyl transferase CofH [Rhodospirillales bacterium]|nr:5-amino-6-(D-ribitylamino)uracil--L-tyrosine 4-hydroxyphenyl transferase CofH [Rhodospirillales bacterium]